MTTTFVLGTLTSISANFINPYTGEILSVNGDYFINDTYVYGGSGPSDTLLSSTHNQFFSLEDSSGALLLEGFETFLMAGGDDILNLASTTNILGDVTISMGSGNDIAWSNNGDDTIQGGAGNDILHGGGGNDTIFGGFDDDILTGGEGNDTLHGEDGFDTVIYHGVYSNYSINDQGAVIYVTDLVGTDGVDTLGTVEKIQFSDGVYENGVFTGNDDVFIATALVEVFDGGAGFDTVDYSQSTSAVKVQIDGANNSGGYADGDTLISIERIIGSDYDDVLLGESNDDTLEGGLGNDSIYGDDGMDTLHGGDGTDKLDGGDGADTIYGDDGDDFLNGGDGSDTMYGGAGRDYMIGGGDGGNDTMYGDDGNDVMNGVAGDDILYGGAGNDYLIGELGNDELYGGDGHDFLRGVTGLNYLSGGNGSDSILGGNWDDRIEGGAGVDKMYGGRGEDTFIFGMDALGSSDHIIDFLAGREKDMLDLSDILSGYDPITQAITDFVQITDNGRDSILAVDINGTQNFTQIATLYDITGLTDEAALETKGILITS